VLAAKRKNLVKQGQGNKPNACRELTMEEEEKLFESSEFGCHNPKVTVTVTVQPKNICNGNKKMPGLASLSFLKAIIRKRQQLQVIRFSFL